MDDGSPVPTQLKIVEADGVGDVNDKIVLRVGSVKRSYEFSLEMTVTNPDTGEEQSSSLSGIKIDLYCSEESTIIGTPSTSLAGDLDLGVTNYLLDSFTSSNELCPIEEVTFTGDSDLDF
jgi:hypothetical protein